MLSLIPLSTLTPRSTGGGSAATATVLLSTSRQLSVDVDEQGFIRLDRYRGNKKINLRRDARFEMLESIRDLSEQYILELKLRRKAIEGDEDGVERIIMVRYVVFTHFSQALYPLIYMIILRRILGTTLAHRTICLDNKLSEEAPGGIGIDSQLDMFNE